MAWSSRFTRRKRLPFPEEHDWRPFIELTQGQPPWPQLVRAVEVLGHPGDALDLGSGGGRDAGYLLLEGFNVTAVDASAWSRPALRRLPRQRRLTFVQSAIEDFEPEEYDLVNAQFVLPFIRPDRFDGCLARLLRALRPGGLLAATFFGPNDQWNVPGTRLVFVTRSQLAALLDELDVIELEEEDHDGHTADGSPKHWHVFHVIARRPPDQAEGRPPR
jgi:tellurite methyltransferase